MLGGRGALWVQAGLALLVVGLLWRVNMLSYDVEMARDTARTWQVSAVSKEAVAKGLAESLRHNDAVLAAWERDRATLDIVSKAARQAVKEALRDDAAYGVWARTSLPAVLGVNGGVLGLGDSRSRTSSETFASVPLVVPMSRTSVERANK